VVIAGSGPLLLAVASTVKRAGGNIVAIIEQAPVSALARFAAGLWRWPEKLRQLGELFPAHYRPASQVIRARGDAHLQSVTVRHGGKIRKSPVTAGYRLRTGAQYRAGLIFGCVTENQAIRVDAWQRTSVEDIYAAGSAPALAAASWRWPRGNCRLYGGG
jgi:thioredoxin reductase